LEKPSTTRKISWKSNEVSVGPDLGARMNQQDPNCVRNDDDEKNLQTKTI